MKKLLCCLSLFLPFSLSSEAPIKSSNPVQTIEKETVINLTEDIIISTTTTPFIASKTFGSKKPEKLIFTSKTKKSIVVSKNSIWDLSSFNSKNKIIELRGNAQLICEPGSKIIFNNGILRFKNTSQWIIS